MGDVSQGTCPSSHPTRLPHIFIENQFNLDSIADKVKPGSFVLAQGDNTGYGWHADFFSGWDDGAIPELFATCPQGSYGNEDIGLCPSFKKFSISNDDCKLKGFFKEKVDKPGKALPGCNPIVDTNPAPMFPTAPLGTYTTDCKAGKSPEIDSSASPGSAPESSVAPAGSSQAGGSPSPSTMVTSTKPTTTKNAHPHHSQGSSASNISCPASNNKLYTVKGKRFRIQCGTDHVAGDLKMVTAHSLGGCVAACSKEDQCVDVSLSGTACYLKSSLGQRETNSAINGAKLVDSGTVGTVTTMGDSASPSEGSEGDVATVTQKRTADVTQLVTVTAGARRHLHNHARGVHLGRRSH